MIRQKVYESLMKYNLRELSPDFATSFKLLYATGVNYQMVKKIEISLDEVKRLFEFLENVHLDASTSALSKSRIC